MGSQKEAANDCKWVMAEHRCRSSLRSRAECRQFVQLYTDQGTQCGNWLDYRGDAADASRRKSTIIGAELAVVMGLI
ncbi:hypothetical protein ASE69_19745 [Sphingomonas sp. Leaf208]|nr:hypothetical protein ASE69_19745 [Sphingomonas sp. Leaf208]